MMLSPNVLASKYVPMLSGFKSQSKRLEVGAGEKKDRNKPPKPRPFLYSWVGFEHLSLQASYYLVQQSWQFSSSQQ